MRSFVLCCAVLITGCSARPDREPSNEQKAGATAVSYPSLKHTLRATLHRPEGAGPFPALLVLHGDFGITDHVKQQAEKLSRQGYVTLVVDLYRGDRPKNLLDAHILDRALPEEQVRADLKAAVDFLTTRSDVKADAMGVLGWDSGGGNALDFALVEPRVRAVVTCYGRLTTDAALLKPLNAAVLGIFAGRDEGITKETREAFRAAMTKAGKKLAGMHVYEKCEHGFLSESKDAEAIADAEKKMTDFLAAELRR